MVLKPLNFGRRLADYRRFQKWSMAKMALKIGVSVDRYEDLEMAMHEPRAGDIIRIERELEIFFDPEDFEPEPQKEGSR